MRRRLPIRTHAPTTLVAALSVVCVAYFALWACAPASTLRPNTPMQAGKTVAAGVSASAALPIRRSSSFGRGNAVVLCNLGEGDGAACASGQAWSEVKLSERVTAGGTLFAGTTSMIGAGGYLRYLLTSSATTRVSLGVSGGWLWTEVSLPVSWRLSDALWLYTNPSVGFRALNAVRLPVGLSVDLGGPRLNVEVGAGGAGGGGSMLALNDDPTLTAYGALGLEWQF